MYIRKIHAKNIQMKKKQPQTWQQYNVYSNTTMKTERSFLEMANPDIIRQANSNTKYSHFSIRILS